MPPAPLAVLVSGGADSAILLAEALDHAPVVYPLYVQAGLVWEEAERYHLQAFLRAVARPTLQPLVTLEVPTADLYGDHWSRTGNGTPAAGTPDADVYLPGRNVLLLSKALLWCHLHRISRLAMAPLAANPFPDATPEFFAAFATVVGQAVQDEFLICRPYNHLHKADVLRRGARLPLHLTFSCIRPQGRRHCGQCSKCYERRMGFHAAGLPDPTDYAHPPPAAGTTRL